MERVVTCRSTIDSQKLLDCGAALRTQMKAVSLFKNGEMKKRKIVRLLIRQLLFSKPSDVV